MRWFIVLLILANLVLFFWLQRDALREDSLAVLPPPDIGRLELLAEHESPAEESPSSARSTDLPIMYTEPAASAADPRTATELDDRGAQGAGLPADVPSGSADTTGAAPLSTSMQTPKPEVDPGAEQEPALGGPAATAVPTTVPASRQTDTADQPLAMRAESLVAPVQSESVPIAESDPVGESPSLIELAPSDPSASVPVADSDALVDSPPLIEPAPADPSESAPVAVSDPVVESPSSIEPAPSDSSESVPVADSDPVFESLSPIGPAPSDSPESVPVAESDALVELPPSIEPAAAVCAQVGPLTPEQAQALLADLPVFVILLSEATEEIRTVNAYFVMIPPLASRAEGLEVLQALDDAGITDTWLFRRGRSRNGISLGLFNRRSGALRRLNDVRQRGFEAEVVERAGTEERRRLLLKNIDGGDLALSLPLPEGVSAEPQPCP